MGSGELILAGEVVWPESLAADGLAVAAAAVLSAPELKTEAKLESAVSVAVRGEVSVWVAVLAALSSFIVSGLVSGLAVGLTSPTGVSPGLASARELLCQH